MQDPVKPPPSTFHHGEKAVHARLAISEKIEGIGQRSIRNFMPDQHRQFFAQLPMIFAASQDEDGRIWAGMLAGIPGFMHSPTPQLLRINAKPARHDILCGQLKVGTKLGMLGLEMHTRRRNRINGEIKEIDSHGFLLEVKQSFGNCPKYIQARQSHFINQAPMVIRHEGDDLSLEMQKIIAQADTYFIASAHLVENQTGTGLDVSHRGGKPGFVQVCDASHLRAPDFAGNQFFNTMGNLLVSPRAGLLFIDFQQGHLLHLSVTARIDWDSQAVAAFQGAQRIWHYQVEHAVLLENACQLAFKQLDSSPYVAETGDW